MALGPFDDRYEAASALEDSDPEEALYEARIAVSLDPEDVDALRLTARLWEEAGETEAARTVWERVLALLPDDPEATEAVAAIDDES